MRWDWTDLQLFVHACDGGSLTAAAERGHLTLAAVSARMQALESRLGVPLLQRHARGVRPTPAGQALARHARAVLAQMAQLGAQVAGEGHAAAAPLRLLANTSALAGRVAGPLAQWLAQRPAQAVQVEESASHLTVQALREGAADLGIVSDAVDTGGLATRALGPDPLVVAVAPGHALARRRSLRFAQVLEHGWIGWGRGSALHAHLALQAARLGRRPRVRASLSQPAAMLALAAQGTGLAVMPQAMLAELPAAARVRTVALDEPWARRQLLLCRPPASAHRTEALALLF